MVEMNGDGLCMQTAAIPINRGIPALIAAAAMSAKAMGGPAPFACLVGDTGRGSGSARLYEKMVGLLPRNRFQTIVFHYLQPMVDWHGKIQAAIAPLTPRPTLIADAGFMYVAKMSAMASHYDLFTPDVGELAFLADEQAPHPFYTRGFILHEDNHVPELISRAYKHGNAARYLLVKGSKDYLADSEGIMETVDSPAEEAMEAIGGTGDTLTGIVSVLIDSGMSIREAAVVAMKTNRLAGQLAGPTPATQISEIIRHIDSALRIALDNNRQ
jgi:hypothetical protein